MSRTGFSIAAFVILVANSSYLASFADPSLFYVGNVLLHVVVGVVGLVAALPLAKRIVGKMRWWPAAGALALTAATGIVLLVEGNLRPMRPVLYAHVSCAVLAAGLTAWALRRWALTGLVAAAVSFPLVVVLSNLPASREVNPPLPPRTMEEEAMGGRQGPFFPSSAATKDGRLIPARFFLGSESCGRSGCHPDIYQQWQSSAHHKASFNNQWYRKSVEYMQSIVGTQPSKWCGGCHDHALLFTGLMDQPVKDQIDRPEAQVGLPCMSCHSIVEVQNTMGNGGFVIEVPALHDLATSNNPWIRGIHDFVLRLDPEPHRRVFLKPFHQGSNAAFCSTCHKVHLDKPVNDYRWLRGFNTYDNWQASGVSGEGARSFYYPSEPMACGDCHMPLVPSNDAGNRNGMIHSHRFAAANTALPTAYGDEAQLQAVTDFLQAGQLTVDLFALVRGGEPAMAPTPVTAGQEGRLASTFAVGEEAAPALPSRPTALATDEEVFAPLDVVCPPLVRGESVRVDAVVRTRNVGHFFPSGTVDAFDVWLELRAVDDTGRVLLWSGKVEDEGKGPVDPDAHFYRSFMLDGHANPINKRNAWATRSVLYARLIPPGAADTVRFRLDVPADCSSEVKLEAKLNYRKFSWWNTQWAYAGVRDPSDTDYFVASGHDDGRWLFSGTTKDVSGVLKEIPDVPIVTMAKAEVTLPVASTESRPMDGVLSGNHLRWNDYGIGLFLQGDLRGAERAFVRVTEVAPEYADGWINVARVRVQEGDPTGAQEMLEKALSLEPDLAKAHYLYALTLKTEGRYDEALEHLRRAAASYPRDRVVRNQIGRIYFLKREFGRAVEELEKTLRIDPEDLEAHYNLMLAYRGLGEADKAALHRQLYLRFKADEASQFITGDFRRLHPSDNNERQRIHEHRNSDGNPGRPYP